MPRRRYSDDRIVRPYDPGDELPSGCFIFCGNSINLSRMAEQQELNYSYLWRIFNCQRQPSHRYAKKIAEYLGMTTAELFAALEPQSGSNAPAQE